MSICRQFLIVATAVNALILTTYADESQQDQGVSEAIGALDEWLGTSSSGDGWRKYLHLDVLDGVRKRDAAIDPNEVVGVLKRLESGRQGLDRPQFVRLRGALRRWQQAHSAPAVADLPQLVKQAKDEFQPVDAGRLKAERARVVQAIAKLRSFLGRGANGRAWDDYLKLQQLLTALDNASEPAVNVLAPTLAQLRTDKVGLDLPQFTALAASLGDYQASVRESQNANAKAEFDARLDKLSEALVAYSATPGDDQLKAIGADLDWLTARRQARPLVEAITYRLSQPNLFVAVESSFIAAGTRRAINDVAPVRDLILGTSIVGTGRTEGNLTFRLVPSSDVATLEAVLEGVNHSRNTGYNGPAVIQTVGTSRLTATKWLTIDADGIHGSPVKAAVDTNTKITGIGSSRGGVMGCVVERVAAKRVGQQKGSAEAIAEQHATTRLKSQFEAQVGVELARANKGFRERFRAPLVRRGQLPQIDFRTTKDHLYVTALQAHGPRLGAQTEPPAAIDNSQINVRLHQSLVNDVAAGALTGQTVGQPELEKLALDFLGEIPERLKDDPGKEPWTITFADADPVTFTLGDGGFTLTGRGKKYTSGDRAFAAMNFTVKYRIEKQGAGIKATRVGDIEIFPPGFVQGGARRLSLRQTTLRTLMSRRLGKIFEPEIVKDQPIELKGNFQAAGPLEVVDLKSDLGWLNLGLRQFGKPAAVASGGDVPAAISTVSMDTRPQ